jgi:hypothetical protein
MRRHVLDATVKISLVRNNKEVKLNWGEKQLYVGKVLLPVFIIKNKSHNFKAFLLSI